jgi:microcystin-dependent protein
MDSMMGQITIFAGNFPPQGWKFCQGQILPISEYEALYTILGTTYGGDGQTTFALPNLSGRSPVSSGQLKGGSNWQLGQINGSETVTLTTSQLGSHNHSVTANNTNGATATPTGQVPAKGLDGGSGTEYTIYETTSNAAMSAASISPSGGSQPHNNMAPFLAINYIICIEGIYPARN